MHACVTRDVADFVERARDFLTHRPVEHNVMATVLAALEPSGSPEPPLFAWVEGGGELVGAALRTPPRRLLVSCIAAEAADALVPAVLAVDRALPGVNGPEPAASHVAEAWRRCTGGTVTPRMSQAIYSLAHVEDLPHQPPGRQRPADRSDRDSLIEWTHAFNREAGMPDLDVEASIDRSVRDAEMFVWEHDDRIVSMVGTRPPVAGVVRLGPVYTPPEERRNGYASALVAGVSRRALARGAVSCMLYADLANPTSNSIYQAIGYRRCRDAREYDFSPDAPRLSGPATAGAPPGPAPDSSTRRRPG